MYRGAFGLVGSAIQSKVKGKDTQTKMKIYSIEIETDLGRRVVKLRVPLDVEPHGDMSQPFRSLTELLWSVLCEVASQGEALAPPRAEA